MVAQCVDENLSLSDSGVTLVVADSFVENDSFVVETDCGNEKHQTELKLKDVRILELSETISQLNDTVLKYKIQSEQQQIEVKNQDEDRSKLSEANCKLKDAILKSEDQLQQTAESQKRSETLLNDVVEENKQLKRYLEEMKKREKELTNQNNEMLMKIKDEEQERQKMKENLHNMTSFFNCICIALKIETRLEGECSYLDAEGHVVLRTAKSKVFKVVEERDQLKANNKELKELVEFLELEEKILKEDIEEACATQVETRLEKVLGAKHLSLEVELECLENQVACCGNEIKASVMKSLNLRELVRTSKELLNEVQVLERCLAQEKDEVQKLNNCYGKLTNEMKCEVKVRLDLEEKLKNHVEEKEDVKTILETERCYKHDLECQIIKLENLIEENQKPKLNCFQKLFMCR